MFITDKIVITYLHDVVQQAQDALCSIKTLNEKIARKKI